MEIWVYILDQLQKEIAVTLLYVLDSEGSSPGRKGFKMAVNEQGQFKGTIGGGIMEVKMIELAKNKLDKRDNTPVIKSQYHDKKHRRNQSGLICSGSQKVALIPLSQKDIPVLSAVIEREETIYLNLSSENGLQIARATINEKQLIRSEMAFDCVIVVNRPKTIHIFGAGHVGVALAQQMSLLGYRIKQYDDRPNLPILQQTDYLFPITLMDYKKLPKNISANPADVVVIVSFSYRMDKIILRQLYKQPFAYMGMMGSDHKIATLRQELAEEGILATDLSHVFMPIGLNMYSKTAEEIAVSIAGQIILETNKNLSTGRNYVIA